MQVSPSVSLFQALSNIVQPQGARIQGAEAAVRADADDQRAAAAKPSRDLSADQTVNAFEAPAPGTPLRRGMLVNLLA